ncbi:hypothetical protein EHJ37_19730 [Vibrio parahaemolyticus]|nr:hypothetical protein [Vibrio parahaemolyticus]
MAKNNDFDPLLVDGKEYSIEHLKDLSLALDVHFDNGDTRKITVNMRPTNHLFSRGYTDDDKQNFAALNKSGELLKSYVHHEGNYQKLKGEPPTLKEYRVFCKEKWGDSFLFPKFVDLITENPAQVTVLANAGDNKTCLSGILNIEDREGEVYLVFFSLTKVNSKEVNMFIESAYCVKSEENHKAKKLLSPSRDDAKPFVIVLKNILEGRKPMEGRKVTGRAKKRKKKSKKA